MLNEMDHSLILNLSVFGSNSAVFGAKPVSVKNAILISDFAFSIYSDQAYFQYMKSRFIWFGHGDKPEALKGLDFAKQLAEQFDDGGVLHKIKEFKLELTGNSGVYVPLVYMNHLQENPLIADLYSVRVWWNREMDHTATGRCLLKTHIKLTPFFDRLALKSKIIQKSLCMFLRPLIILARIRNQKFYNKCE